MFNYTFTAEEVLLTKGSIFLTNENKKAELYLTNLFITVITTLESDNGEIYNKQAYSVNEIKIYKGTPQIKRNGLSFEIYFTTDVLAFKFEDKKSANNFMNEAITLLTEKSFAQRKADMVKNVVDVIDKTFGIDTVGSIKNAIGQLGQENKNGFGIKTGKNNPLAKLTFIERKTKIDDQPQKNESEEFENKYNALKKLKELLDGGIITQEEFDRQKSKILENE